MWADVRLTGAGCDRCRSGSGLVGALAHPPCAAWEMGAGVWTGGGDSTVSLRHDVIGCVVFICSPVTEFLAVIAPYFICHIV